MPAENKFDTSLVILYPVDRNGQMYTKEEKEKRYVKIDRDRREVPITGIVIEKWKADHVTQSPKYMHLVGHADLTEAGLAPGEEDYTKRLGAITDRPKYAYRIPKDNEIAAAIAPVDEQRIAKIIAAEPFYANVLEEFGTAIRAQMRIKSDLDLHAMFEGLASAMPGYADCLADRMERADRQRKAG